MAELVLASTSPFRRELLSKLGLPFTTCSPDIDETAGINETPQQLVKRLAQQKAQAVAEQYPAHLIIGSDQVAVCNEQVLGKPHTRDNAIQQLTSFSGQTVTFYTGLALLNSQSNQVECIVEPFYVDFRQLSQDEIIHYVEKEQPLNCAGSFKSEGLGIALFKALRGDDPNSLIGLPLIQLCAMLKRQGLSVL